MDKTQIASFLLILGTTLTYTGFGIFPARIYTSKNIQERLGLLAAMPLRWVISQAFVILGSLVTVAGSIFLISYFSGSQGILFASIGAIGFVLGHIFWIWQLRLRIIQPPLFAKNELPGWLFTTFSVLALLGIANFGIAFGFQGIHQLLGACLFFAGILVLVLFLKFKDMPPFIYYALTMAIGLTLLFV